MEYDGFPLPVGTYRKMLEEFAADLPQEKILTNRKVLKIQKEEKNVIIEAVNETN